MDFIQDEAIATYRDLAKIPSLAGASFRTITPDAVTITSSWSQRDIERSTIVKFNRSHIVLRDSDRVIDGGCITEQNEEKVSCISKCGKYRALVRAVKDKKGDEKQYLEIWDSTSKVKNISLSALDKHDKVYFDADFCCLEFSPCGKKILYIAEKKKPKTSSFFERKCSAGDDSAEDNKKEDEISKGDQYIFEDQWGETNVGKCFPVICVLDLDNESVTVMKEVPEGVSPAEATWAPDDGSILFTGYYHDPYKLGIVYCQNRRSALFLLNPQTKTCEPITGTDHCVANPRFNLNKSKFVYLQSRAGGPHRQCTQLMLFNWSTKISSVIIDIVNRPTTSSPFPGIFCWYSLPLQCWCNDNKRVCFSSIWRSKVVILSVNTSTKSVERLTNDEQYGTWSVCDIRNDMLLAYRRSPTMTGQLVLGDLSSAGSGDLTWKPLDDHCCHFQDFSWEILCLPQSDGLDVEGILYVPLQPRQSPPPLIVFPHGGPHSTLVADYLMMITFFVKLGFSIILVNYRGSLGFGNDSINSLPGKISHQEVGDVQAMAEHVLSLGHGSRDHVICTGGSHGGFTSLHLIGQYPDFYKCCAVRNPVANLAAMFTISDIPDWCNVEAGLGEFDFAAAPTAEVYKAMIEASPISHVHKVKTPTLFLIGAVDVRVPPLQAQEYYKRLVARGIKTRMNVYPENTHSLAKLEAESDCFVNMVKWFWDNL